MSSYWGKLDSESAAITAISTLKVKGNARNKRSGPSGACPSLLPWRTEDTRTASLEAANPDDTGVRRKTARPSQTTRTQGNPAIERSPPAFLPELREH